MSNLFDSPYWETIVRISTIVLVLMVTLFFGKIVKRLMLKKQTFVKVDTTQYKFLSHFLAGVIYFVGIIFAIYMIPTLRGLATSWIFAGSGVMAIVVGFASKHAFANIVSGIFIALYKPIRIGDRVKLMSWEHVTVVEDITLRHTVLRTFENRRIIIPNSIISNEILENSNIVDEKVLKFFEIGISYDADLEKAMAIIKAEAMNHPDFMDNRSEEQIKNNDEPIKVRLISFGDFSLNLRAYIWVKDPSTAFNLGCDLNKSVKKRFDEEGIEIPFPYRTLVFKKNGQGGKEEEKIIP